LVDSGAVSAKSQEAALQKSLELMTTDSVSGDDCYQLLLTEKLGITFESVKHRVNGRDVEVCVVKSVDPKTKACVQGRGTRGLTVGDFVLQVRRFTNNPAKPGRIVPLSALTAEKWQSITPANLCILPRELAFMNAAGTSGRDLATAAEVMEALEKKIADEAAQRREKQKRRKRKATAQAPTPVEGPGAASAPAPVEVEAEAAAVSSPTRATEDGGRPCKARRGDVDEEAHVDAITTPRRQPPEANTDTATK